jgi:hypothetical protein
VVASLATLGGCVGGPSPETYAEAALRADARDAALDQGTSDPDRPAPLDTAAVSEALGGAGELRGNVYLVRVRRCAGAGAGCAIDARLAFHPAVGARAALTGDVAVPGRVAGATARALAARGVQVTATHAESTTGSVVLSVWGMGDAAELARNLSRGLEHAAQGSPAQR